MAQYQCDEWIYVCPILMITLKTLGGLPIGKHLNVMYLSEQLKTYYLMETERPIECPQDSERQKSYNLKSDLLCTSNKRILWLSQTYNDIMIRRLFMNSHCVLRNAL